MKGVLRALGKLAGSRAVTPVVIGFFFLFYLGIAFVTDETLVTLMDFTRGSLLLSALLALIPLNGAARLALAARAFRERRRALAGAAECARAELFDETVTMAGSTPPDQLDQRLAALGYRTRSSGRTVAAWRGLSVFPARALFLAGTCCLFAGILISLTSRDSRRVAVIEGEPLRVSAGAELNVERLTLAKSDNPLLDKTLVMKVATPGAGQGGRVFGLYPPALFAGYFVYPRYLGIAPLVRFSAPDLAKGCEAYAVLNIYPPGKEDTLEIAGTPYRLALSIAEPEGDNEPYQSGRMSFQFKLLRGKDQLLAGSAPLGGSFARDGYRLEFPDYRRMVYTDFIRDWGVLLVWGAALCLLASALCWLPVRLFWPRQEMLFVQGGGALTAHARAEGARKSHAGVFQEVLDLVEAGRVGAAGRAPAVEASDGSC